MIVQLSLETFGDHETAAAAEAEMRDLIAEHPEFTDIVSPPGITIGRYRTTVAVEGERYDLGPGEVVHQEPPTTKYGVRYNAYATLVKPDQP